MDCWAPALPANLQGIRAMSRMAPWDRRETRGFRPMVSASRRRGWAFLRTGRVYHRTGRASPPKTPKAPMAAEIAASLPMGSMARSVPKPLREADCSWVGDKAA